MASSPSRASALSRWRNFAPALALAAIGVLLDHPGAALALIVAQPLFVAGAVSALGYLLDIDFATLALRRGIVFLVLYVPLVLLVAGAVATPMLWLGREASLPHAALVSAGIALSVLALWRLWPAYGLAFLWDDAYPEDAPGSWIVTAVKRTLAFAWHLTGQRERHFGAGLAVSLALIAVALGAMVLAGRVIALPSEMRIGALWLHALVLSPLAAFIVAWRTERLLLDARVEEPADEADALADDHPLAAPAPVPTPTRDPAQRNAQLLAAAAANQVESALSLLRAGGNADAVPDAADRDQRSLAIIAATCPDLRLLRELIARGADLNRAIGGLTPLIAATRDSYHGRPDAVMMLLTNGADPRAADGEGNTALHYAALTRDASVAAILLDAGADATVANREGLTPLGVACAAGNEVIARFMLEHRVRPEIARTVPALIACAGGADDDAGLVRLLLKHKAELDARDRMGRTALHTAALHGHAEIVDVLIGAGAELDARDLNGVTPLMEAARAGSNRVLQRLVFRKPNPDFTDGAGRTALMIACQSRQANDDTARLLLALGCDTTIAAKDGRRAIDCAVAAGRWAVVAALDPNYPLPNAVIDAAEDADADDGTPAPDRATLLASALRHGREVIARELLDLAPPPSPAELERVFLAVAGDVDAARLGWLTSRGFDVEAVDADGASLLARLLRVHPLPLAAIDALLDRAVTCGGGVLRDLLVLERDGERAAAIERLACTLLARGADPFAADARGRSVLHLAVAHRFATLANDLLARGVDANRPDARGRTALHELAALPESQSLPLARALLRAGADPERAAADGQTPLGAALAAGRDELTQWLSWNGGLRHPARPLRGADLPAAAQQGDLGAARRLIELGVAIDSRDAQGCTALLRACGGGHVQLVELLLERGADPTIPAGTGATCLSAAVTARRDAVVHVLLARGFDADQRLPGGSTPLMVAAALGSVTIVRTLLDRGASARLVDELGNGALHAAAQFAFTSADADRCRQLLRQLIDAGAPVDGANAAGQTPLLLLLGARAPAAAPTPQRALVELMQLLIAQGADVARQDERGVGVLHACAMHGLIDAALALVRAGADPQARDRLGRTAHEVALMLGYADVAGELRRSGHAGPRERAPTR